MAKTSSVDQAALAFKILDGKASPEEQHAFELWLSQNQEHWEEFADLKMLWENSHYQPNEADPQAFEQIKRIVERDRKKKRVIRYMLYMLALIVLSTVIYIATSRFMAPQSANLKFEDAPISQIITDIETIYQIKIEYDTTITNCKFSGIFYRNEQPEAIIWAIAKSLNIQVLKPAKNTFKLIGKGC